MSPFWKIFVAIFCYITAVVGIGLAAINATHEPPATAVAAAYGAGGAVFLLAAVAMSRRPRY